MAATGVLSLMAVGRDTGEFCGTVKAAELLLVRKRAFLRDLERSTAFQMELQRTLEKTRR